MIKLDFNMKPRRFRIDYISYNGEEGYIILAKYRFLPFWYRIKATRSYDLFSHPIIFKTLSEARDFLNKVVKYYNSVPISRVVEYYPNDIKEGTQSKGGVNEKPTSGVPSEPPKPQGVVRRDT
jgi:hypothetical protein